MKGQGLLFPFILLFSIISFSPSCTKEDQPVKPLVTINQPDSVTSNSAVVESTVSSPDGSAIIARGVCWSTTEKPTIVDAHTSDGTGEGSFKSKLTNLLPATTYFVRAFAVTSNSYTYGEQLTLTTIESIKITTTTATDITTAAATAGGNVISEGALPVIVRGICWSKAENPSILDNKTEDGEGLGEFTSNIGNLETGTRYYARAYAINAEDTVYGDNISFITNSQDIDGNIYHAVVIGTQVWMVENLKVTRYRNGDPLPNILDNDLWTTYTEGAYCNYANDSAIGDVYGRLYNWASINDPRNICPEGWHLPTNDEWLLLENYLGGNTVAGGKMKEEGTARWTSPNTDATNSSGFTGIPAGNRGYEGFFDLGNYCYFWADPSSTFSLALKYNDGSTSGIGNTSSILGISIRCIKNN